MGHPPLCLPPTATSCSPTPGRPAATPAQLAAGLDLADVLLREWPGYPPGWEEHGELAAEATPPMPLNAVRAAATRHHAPR